MISWNYITNIVRQHRLFLLFTFIFVGLFQVLILTFVVGADLLGFVEQFLRQLPSRMQVLFGEQFMAQLSINGAVAFGYNHPLVVAMLIIVAILLPARHIAGEIEAGSLELLFAMPIKRYRIALSLWLVAGGMLLVAVAGGWTGTGCGLLLFPEARGAPILRVIGVGLSLWLLVFTISSYTMLIASHSNEGGKSTLRAAGLTLVFYFMNVAAILWPRVDFLSHFTIFHYHQPQQVMMGEPVLGKNAAVLGALALVCAGLAIRQVSRRDVPG
ncbi:MAG: ABC transporter permease subunit [Candidatus Latescibacterota bacterium]|nr:MAG: ABC transporter permease subunit [Candidatus Latescibacterota bacterium]